MRPQTPSDGNTTNQYTQNLSFFKALAGNVSFGNPTTFDINGIPTSYTQDNLTGNIFRHQFAVANADETIIHNLGRVPIGYIVTRKDQAADVYDGTLAGWTETEIVLKCTATADISIYIF